MNDEAMRRAGLAPGGLIQQADVAAQKAFAEKVVTEQERVKALQERNCQAHEASAIALDSIAKSLIRLVEITEARSGQ